MVVDLGGVAAVPPRRRRPPAPAAGVQPARRRTERCGAAPAAAAPAPARRRWPVGGRSAGGHPLDAGVLTGPDPQVLDLDPDRDLDRADDPLRRPRVVLVCATWRRSSISPKKGRSGAA